MGYDYDCKYKNIVLSYQSFTNAHVRSKTSAGEPRRMILIITMIITLRNFEMITSSKSPIFFVFVLSDCDLSELCVVYTVRMYL